MFLLRIFDEIIARSSRQTGFGRKWLNYNLIIIKQNHINAKKARRRNWQCCYSILWWTPQCELFEILNLRLSDDYCAFGRRKRCKTPVTLLTLLTWLASQCLASKFAAFFSLSQRSEISIQSVAPINCFIWRFSDRSQIASFECYLWRGQSFQIWKIEE